jgi:hypothetical protein
VCKYFVFAANQTPLSLFALLFMLLLILSKCYFAVPFQSDSTVDLLPIVLSAVLVGSLCVALIACLIWQRCRHQHKQRFDNRSRDLRFDNRSRDLRFDNRSRDERFDNRSRDQLNQSSALAAFNFRQPLYEPYYPPINFYGYRPRPRPRGSPWNHGILS